MRWLASLLLLFASLDGEVALAGPERVVSINVCTDQLAMLLAGPDQLRSISYLSRDPRISPMAAEAANVPVNRGKAEEVYLLRPDLVLAGSFSSRATIDMLQRLGVRVVVFEPAYSFDDIRDHIIRMGALLDHSTKAAQLVTRFDRDLARLAGEGADRPRAAIYAAQGYTSGPESLAGSILDAAGFRNVATELGLGIGGQVALEQLLMLEPDIVVLPASRPRNSRAEELLHHPVLAALSKRIPVVPLSDHDWSCGTPNVLAAVDALVRARQSMENTR